MALPSSQDPRAQPTWENVTLFLLTLSVLALCWMMAVPFLHALVGSITLAVVTNQPYRWLESKCRRPALAAIIAVAVVTVLVITPISFLIQELAKQALAVATLMREGTLQQKIVDLLNQHPALASRLESATANINLKQATQTTAAYMASHLGGVLSNSVGALLQLVVMMFILFFLYRDHKLALSTLRSILPLSESETDLVLSRSTDTIYATALGRFIVAAVQGLLAGLAFWALGVRGAFLLGLLTALVAVVPGVGAYLVWVPVAVYLALSGHWVKALILTGWGSVVVSTVDNFLYPALVGSKLQMHTVAVLLAVLGGIAFFGISGIILGPVLLTLAKTLLGIWVQKTRSAALIERS
jgi:predicted PurR-regulated permease PerM